MTQPAPRRSRGSILLGTAAVLAMATLAQAQQPPSGAAPAPAAAAAKKPAASGAPQAGGDSAAASEKNAVSYSVGVSMGDQLRSAGIAADALNSQRLLQGIHDALSGKAKLTAADQTNISRLLRSSLAEAVETNHRAAAKFLEATGKKPGVVTTASGLQYKVLTPGSGESPKATDEVTVNYRGTLLDGTQFDSSYQRGEPATLPLAHVIPGWTEGLQLMKPGAKYQLFVPPQLAYDTHPKSGLPPGSMLIFEVELLSFKPAPSPASAAPPTAQPSAPTPK